MAYDPENVFAKILRGELRCTKPNWSLMDLTDVADLPSVRWKLLNLDRMSEAKHAAAFDRLRLVLAG